MKKPLTIIIAVAIFTTMALSPIFTISQGSFFFDPGKSETKPQYFSGMITIKLKPGYGNFNRQEGQVSFNSPTLDERLQKYQVDLLEKRFRYQPYEVREELPDLSRIYRITFPETYQVKMVARDFASDPAVEYAEPIPVKYPDEVPNDPKYGTCMHLEQISAPAAWDIHHGEDGAETVIAMIDDGVDWKHIDLVENIYQRLGEDADGDGKTLEFIAGQWVFDPDDVNGIDDDMNGHVDDFIGWDAGYDDNNPFHNLGDLHGTHCAGISAGRTDNGTGISSISWNVKVMPLKATDESGRFTNTDDCFIYAAQNGADIISCSYGGGYSQSEYEVIQFAIANGCIINASAGNADKIEPHFPSDYPGVISVAAVNADDSKAVYSSFGPATDISAPGGGIGGGIMSTLPFDEYDNLCGTSMSSPLIAGCLGLLKSYQPDWTNEQIIHQLIGTADNIDSVNPDYPSLLGSGRVNAYRFLTETNVTLPEELRMNVIQFSSEDENGNQLNEIGEEVTFSFTLMNFALTAGQDDVMVTLTSDDPDIVMVDDTAVIDIMPDGISYMEETFVVRVDSSAESHFASFTLHYDTELPIVYGQDYTFELLVAPSGIFVYEFADGRQGYSGSDICAVMDALGIHYTYSTTFPASLSGFETAFMSPGNYGSSLTEGYFLEEEHALMYQDFLENGGNLYLELSGIFSGMGYFNYPNLDEMMELFGVTAIPPVITEPHVFDTLTGTAGTPFEGISFHNTKQKLLWYIDAMQVDTTVSTVPFVEEDYGNISIMREETEEYGFKLFYLCYTLGDFVDRDAESSRYNLILKILDFFGYDLPEGYMVANFIKEQELSADELVVQFTDISLVDEGYDVSTWEWDFNNDGTIDSYEQNPEWTFTDPGTYDVKLIISGESNSDTLLKEGFVHLNGGFLIYDGDPGWQGYSGLFIRDYFGSHGNYYTYTGEFPESLLGYDAAFISLGAMSEYQFIVTELNNLMADVIADYLMNGGFVYLDGAEALGYDQQENTELLSLFGIESADDGGYNPVDSLGGFPDALTSDMLFTASNQQTIGMVDTYEPAEGAIPAFRESDYGIVAVQNEGEYGQRTFCSSYALIALQDEQEPNTREELLRRICAFFDIYTGVDEPVTGSSDLMVYPNPVRDQFTIRGTESSGRPMVVSIFSITGNCLHQQQFNPGSTGEFSIRMNLGSYPAGMYFIQVQWESRSMTKKMIKM